MLEYVLPGKVGIASTGNMYFVGNLLLRTISHVGSLSVLFPWVADHGKGLARYMSLVGRVFTCLRGWGWGRLVDHSGRGMVYHHHREGVLRHAMSKGL